MQAGKVSNHPLAVVLFPVKWSAPLFAIHGFPAFGKPPVKVLITTVLYEFEKVAIADRSFIERVVLQKDLVRRLLVIECEVVRTVRPRAVVADSKQSAFNLGHARDLR